MIVPLPIYVTSETQARSSVPRLLGDLELCGAGYPERFFSVADATIQAMQSMELQNVEDLAQLLVSAVEHYGQLRADHAVVERRARENVGGALWLANTLIDLCHRYDRLGDVLTDLSARASTEGSALLPLKPTPLRIL